MRTHRADQGRAIGANLPVASGAATGPDGVSAETFLVAANDLQLCTSAVVRLEGWQAWYSEIAKTQGADK
jgi:hypothetical protein